MRAPGPGQFSLHTEALGARLGLQLWHLGSADQGRAKIREANSLSERLKNSASMMDALMLASVVFEPSPA